MSRRKLNMKNKILKANLISHLSYMVYRMEQSPVIKSGLEAVVYQISDDLEIQILDGEKWIDGVSSLIPNLSEYTMIPTANGQLNLMTICKMSGVWGQKFWDTLNDKSPFDAVGDLQSVRILYNNQWIVKSLPAIERIRFGKLLGYVTHVMENQCIKTSKYMIFTKYSKLGTMKGIFSTSKDKRIRMLRERAKKKEERDNRRKQIDAAQIRYRKNKEAAETIKSIKDNKGLLASMGHGKRKILTNVDTPELGRILVTIRVEGVNVVDELLNRIEGDYPKGTKLINYYNCMPRRESSNHRYSASNYMDVMTSTIPGYPRDQLLELELLPGIYKVPRT